jgi:hypothetical protein
MPSSSAAAVELLIAERNASRIISRFSGSDDKHLGHSTCGRSFDTSHAIA